MTSNGDVVHPISTIPTGTVEASILNRDRPVASVKQAPLSHSSKPSPPLSSKNPPTSSSSNLQNGDQEADDAQNESEAETVVLADAAHDGEPEKNVTKTEPCDEDDKARLRSVREISADHGRATNGRRGSSSNPKDTKTNGAKDAKSPIPTSPSSPATSSQDKDTSPTEATKSSPRPAASPSVPTTRGRSSSTLDSRKRKVRDEQSPKHFEPPRQKAKTEAPTREPHLLRNQPTSPSTVGPGRVHKRSQSSQSILQGTQGRTRREISQIVLPERKNWSDSSSENSSSPRPVQPRDPALHARVKRSSHRALTSPARAMGHSKKNVDQFGATRLARESEKGDLDGVKAAYKAAPEEMNQADFAGIAPLQKASLHGWTEVVEFLLRQGCRTDCESNDRDTPLIDAVENGHLDVVQLLLGKGRVNPHHQNKKGQRAIDVLNPEDDAAEDIEKELKEAMRNTNETYKDEEKEATRVGQQKNTSRLLYNEFNTETLIEKAGEGDILAVGELIGGNIKPNIACGVAAARGGHYDILSILLASGLKVDPDPSKHSETPMLVAIGRGHLKIIHLLLDQDSFDPTRRNREGQTYYEISEERRGPKWEQERDILKAAYDSHRQSHRSPKRSKKDAPVTSNIRTKRRSSPRGDRSSSPRPEGKRANLLKSSTISTVVPQKTRGRLITGRELATQRDVKRRRRIVSEESSDEESEEEVRPHKKKTKPRSYSEGEEQNLTKKVKARPEDHDPPKRSKRAQSEESDGDHRRKPVKKQSTRASMGDREKNHNVKPTPEADSPDDRKPTKRIISKTRNGDQTKTKESKRPLADEVGDDTKSKKTPTLSAKSTPAPPEKASTPESVRESRRQEEERLAEMKRQAEAEEAARKAAEEEAARQAAEAEEARKKAEAEAEAKRLAEEAEAARIAAEAEAKRVAEEQARQAAREERVTKLPKALKRAVQMGSSRPLRFAGEELGISAIFLPLIVTPRQEIDPSSDPNVKDQPWIMSFQAVGILGLAEVDLAYLDNPYSEWPRREVTRKQRERFLKYYDIALLAQAFRFPMPNTPEFDDSKIQSLVKEARQQFMDMEGMYWVPHESFFSAAKDTPTLKDLLPDMEVSKSRPIHFRDIGVESGLPEKTHKPRRSFLDTVLGRQPSVNGTGPG